MSTRFEEHMKIVNDSHKKTAGAKEAPQSLLSKLAAELESENTKTAADTMTPARVDASATVATAAPATVALTDSVAVPQTDLAGGNEAEKAKGEQPAATKPNQGVVISAADGKVTDANNLSKVPEAVAEAAQPTSKTASIKEAEEIGRAMAHAYSDELQKIAVDQQFGQAVEILKEAGLLDGYTLNAELTKVAAEEVSPLEKIEKNEPLTKSDMVKAASDYLELVKQAQEADEAGRVAAREFVDNLKKVAAEETAEEKKEDEKKEEKKDEKKEEEKTSSDKMVAAAVQILKDKKLI